MGQPTFDRTGFVTYTTEATGTDELSETITFDRPFMMLGGAAMVPTTSVLSVQFQGDTDATNGPLVPLRGGALDLDATKSTAHSATRIAGSTRSQIVVTTTGGVSGNKAVTLYFCDLSNPSWGGS